MIFAFVGSSASDTNILTKISEAGSVQYSDGPQVSINSDRKLQVVAGGCFADLILISYNNCY